MTATEVSAPARGTTPDRVSNVVVEPPARSPEAAVDPIFTERWSPRAFSSEPVDPAAVRSLFEAARWAPSSANEQPWLFLYATSPADRARFAEGLLDMNRAWAAHAPMLVYLLARRTIRSGDWAGRPNPTSWFDAGAAWMSLALQAQILGLSVHAMAGIDREKVARLLDIPTADYDVIAAVAIGRRGDAEQLPPILRARERPSGRRPLGEIAVEGNFPARERDAAGPAPG